MAWGSRDHRRDNPQISPITQIPVPARAFEVVLAKNKIPKLL
jgi:hypothetical protein